MPKKKILLIDDDQDFVDMLTDLMVANGYDVLVANSGEEGIAKCKENIPDLILLDIMLPQIDGFEVLYTLRNLHNIKAIPIIMVTGKTEMESFFQAKGFGATDYIMKPFHPEDLVALVTKHISPENPV